MILIHILKLCDQKQIYLISSIVLNLCYFHSLTSVTSPSNSTPRLFPSYLLLYFRFIFYLPRWTLSDFPYISSLASLPFLSCFHGTTTTFGIAEISTIFVSFVHHNFRLKGKFQIMMVSSEKSGADLWESTHGLLKIRTDFLPLVNLKQGR